MIDLTFLRSFTKGNPQKIKKYVKMYLQFAPPSLAQMQQQLADQDWQQLAITAHSLKPQVEYMGLNKMKEILIEIETKSKAGQTDELPDLCKSVFQINKEASKELQDFLDE